MQTDPEPVFEHLAQGVLPDWYGAPIVCIYHDHSDHWAELAARLRSKGAEVVMVRATSQGAGHSWVPEPQGNGCFYLEELGLFRASLVLVGHASTPDEQAFTDAAVPFSWNDQRPHGHHYRGNAQTVLVPAGVFSK